MKLAVWEIRIYTKFSHLFIYVYEISHIRVQAYNLLDYTGYLTAANVL